MLSRKYELDMVPGSIPLSIHLSQYDNDVTLVFELYASQGTLDIPTDATAKMRGTKLDGNGISADATYEAINNIPTVSVRVTKQMTAVAGKNTFEIVLMAEQAGNTYELPSANFYLDIEPAALDYGTLESESEIKEIMDILSRADEIVEALDVSQATQQNMAALTQRAETAASSADSSAGLAIQAKDEAVSARDTAVSAVQGFNDTVNSAASAAAQSVQSEGAAQVARVQNAADGLADDIAGTVQDARNEITAAKAAAVSDMQDEADAAIEAVEAAQTTAVGEVNNTKDTAMTAINARGQEIVNITTTADTNAALALQQANQAMNEVSGVEESVQSVETNVSNLELLLSGKVDGGYVENNALYLTSNGEVVAGPFEGIGGGGGSGGGSTNSAVITMNNTTGWVSRTIAGGADISVSIFWSSIEDNLPTGNGTLSIKVGSVVKSVYEVAQGDLTIPLQDYLSTGTNTVQIQVSDSYGNSRVKDFTVTVAELYITSSFDDSVAQTGILAFPYTPYGAVAKTVHFILDGNEQETVSTSVSGRQQTYIFTAQSHGAHTLRVYFEAAINGSIVRSNELYYEIIWLEALNNTPIIASSYDVSSVAQFMTVNIPYTVYTPSSQMSDVVIRIGGVVKSEVTVDRSQQVFSVRLDHSGLQTITIISGSAMREFNITVVPADIDCYAETENLSLYLASASRSNHEANPAVWTYGEGEGQIAAAFSGFNWSSDGWQMDEDGITALRVSGNGRVTIPFKPFAQDFRTTGKTIEIEFATRDVLNYDAVILSCMDQGRGISMTAQSCTLASEQSSISMQFKEDEHVRVGFVVEKRSGFRRIYCYINGTMCGVVQYPDNDDFSQVTPRNISIGSSYCTTDIYCIRVYDNDLTMQQMEDNWIADTQDGALMLERYTHNNVRDAYGNVVISKLPSDLPYMIIECDELPQYKGDKKTVSGSYTDPLNPSKSFTFTGCQADVQGTSSQYYERKNYKLKFKSGIVNANGMTVSAYQLRSDSIPTNAFCMKADVASSEGANNVELAILYNDACPYRTPTQVKDERIRQGIDGFPIVIFWHDTVNDETTFLGKYNFNNDKGNEEVFGFEDGDESWEVKNNTGDRVLWKSDDYTGTDWLYDFEARYPDTDPAYTDPAQLAEFASWIKGCDPDQATGNALPESVTIVDGETSTTYSNDTAAYRRAKFRAELGDYVETQSALFYYLFTELFLMVDSRAKNMFPSFIGTKLLTEEEKA